MYGSNMQQDFLKNTEERLYQGVYSPCRRSFLAIPPENLTIGGRIRRERILRKYSIEQLADYLQISSSYLGAIERGVRPVTMRIMERLHEKMGMSFDFIIEGRNITNSMISQYVRESPNYNMHHNIDVLLNVCDERELESCYNMVRAYLTQHRDTEDAKREKLQTSHKLPEQEKLLHKRNVKKASEMKE